MVVRRRCGSSYTPPVRYSTDNQYINHSNYYLLLLLPASILNNNTKQRRWGSNIVVGRVFVCGFFHGPAHASEKEKNRTIR